MDSLEIAAASRETGINWPEIAAYSQEIGANIQLSIFNIQLPWTTEYG